MLLSAIIILTILCSGNFGMGPAFTPPGHNRGNKHGHGNSGNNGKNKHGNHGHGNQGQGNQGHGNQGHGNQNQGNNQNKNKNPFDEPPFPEHLVTQNTITTHTTKAHTTASTTTEADYYDIDIRFGGRRKRANNYFESSTKSDNFNNFGYYPRWSRPVTKYNNYEPEILDCNNKFECVPESECKIISPKSRRTYCEWGERGPFVCCERPRNEKIRTIERNCGRSRANGYSQAIIGGVSVRSGIQYPWMTAIGEALPNDSVVWFCGGALISEKTVLTAAHCTSRRKADLVRIGETDLTQNLEDSPYLQEIKICQTTPHPLYRPPTLYNDIALLILEAPVRFNPSVRPICLPKRAAYYNPIALLTGWGQLNFASEQSSTLQAVTVRLFNTSFCDQQYSVTPASKRNFPNGILETQLCAGDEEGGKDACQGDSGAPLVSEEDGSFVLIGLVSAGIGCGSKMFPGVYTRVATYTPWILENII